MRESTLDESVSRALSATLDTLTAEQRVAFVLHDVFGVSYAAVGDLVGSSPEASRALAGSARRQLRGRVLPVEAAHDSLVGALHAAWLTAAASRLAAVLAPDVSAVVDGGSLVVGEVHGDLAVARLMLQLFDLNEVTMTQQQVNGQSGLVVRAAGRATGIVCVDVTGPVGAQPRVGRVWLVLNPAKLADFNRT